MFLSEIPQVLLRRWYIVVIGLLMTAGLVYIAAQVTPPAYDITAEALLLPPSTAVPKGGNPYLSLGGLDAVGDILAKSMTDAPTVQAMTAAGLKDDYTLGRDVNSAAPVMLINVTADTDTSAVAQSRIILDRLPIALRSMQERLGIPANSMITASVVVRPDQAAPSRKGQMRSVLVAGVAGLALTLLIAAVIDAVIRRRSTGRAGGRRAAKHAGNSTPTPTIDTVDAAPDQAISQDADFATSVDRT